jgi:transposase
VAHLAEHGVIAPQGLPQIGQLITGIDDPDSRLPGTVRELGRLLVEQITWLDTKIMGLAKAIRAAASHDEEVARLMGMPGIGPICAMAIRAFAPPMESFGSGRDFAAWLGIVPRQLSTGGKARLGKTSRMGQRDIRRLLIIGAMTVVRWAACKGAPAGSWLDRMLARKPKMLVAMALANKMARMIWAMMTKKESYRAPTAAAA